MGQGVDRFSRFEVDGWPVGRLRSVMLLGLLLVMTLSRVVKWVNRSRLVIRLLARIAVIPGIWILCLGVGGVLGVLVVLVGRVASAVSGIRGQLLQVGMTRFRSVGRGDGMVGSRGAWVVGSWRAMVRSRGAMVRSHSSRVGSRRGGEMECRLRGGGVLVGLWGGSDWVGARGVGVLRGRSDRVGSWGVVVVWRGSYRVGAGGVGAIVWRDSIGPGGNTVHWLRSWTVRARGVLPRGG